MQAIQPSLFSLSSLSILSLDHTKECAECACQFTILKRADLPKGIIKGFFYLSSVPPCPPLPRLRFQFGGGADHGGEGAKVEK